MRLSYIWYVHLFEKQKVMDRYHSGAPVIKGSIVWLDYKVSIIARLIKLECGLMIIILSIVELN